MYIPLTFEGALQKCLFASGGYEGFFLSGSRQYKYHWFTGSATLEVQKGTIDNVEIYVVGGGGGGGNRNTAVGAGGGGGGGVNYTTTGRLFQGNYSVVVGAGGIGPDSTNTNGFSGVSSSFIGSNINMIAGGGGGGIGLDASTGGTGGTPNGGNGGSGGTTSAANGQTGILISFAGEPAFGFGCGGGGASNVSNPNDQGFSCNDTQFGDGANGGNFANNGANRYGMGGGGGNNVSSSADGGSGSVMIQYPIFDYCTNYFNETGSCGCRQITFDTTDQLNYYPQLTGSFLYQPCGENRFVSGSLIAYAPLTVCAVSNSYYSYTIGDVVDPIVVQNIAGFVTSGPQCVSASLVPLPCTIENFVPTCTSSIVTIYAPSASVGNPTTFGYVEKNQTTSSIYTTTVARVKYLCISTGSLYNGINIYPKVLTGGSTQLFNTASCNTVTFTATWSGVGASNSTATMRYTQCDGSQTELVLQRGATSGTTVRSGSVCADGIGPISTRYSGAPVPSLSVTYGESCLSSFFNTASCGCP